MRYKREQIAQWDAYADLDTAKKEGREEGMEIGEEKGIAIGEKKGIAIGKEKIIRNLVNSGKFNVSEIAFYAGVTEAVVRKVKNNIRKG